MTARGFLRVFGVCALILWALLITVLLSAHTVIAVRKARGAWRDLTWRDTHVAATDTSLTTGDTILTDTMATDTADADNVPKAEEKSLVPKRSVEEDLADIRAREAAKKAGRRE